MAKPDRQDYYLHIFYSPDLCFETYQETFDSLKAAKKASKDALKKYNNATSYIHHVNSTWVEENRRHKKS